MRTKEKKENDEDIEAKEQRISINRRTLFLLFLYSERKKNPPQKIKSSL